MITLLRSTGESLTINRKDRIKIVPIDCFDMVFEQYKSGSSCETSRVIIIDVRGVGTWKRRLAARSVAKDSPLLAPICSRRATSANRTLVYRTASVADNSPSAPFFSIDVQLVVVLRQIDAPPIATVWRSILVIGLLVSRLADSLRFCVRLRRTMAETKRD